MHFFLLFPLFLGGLLFGFFFLKFLFALINSYLKFSLEGLFFGQSLFLLTCLSQLRGRGLIGEFSGVITMLMPVFLFFSPQIILSLFDII